jgi:hypothetical protein
VRSVAHLSRCFTSFFYWFVRSSRASGVGNSLHILFLPFRCGSFHIVLFPTVHVDMSGIFRSDHVRTVAHLRCLSLIPIAQSSRANGVDFLFIYTYSTKFTCERG